MKIKPPLATVGAVPKTYRCYIPRSILKTLGTLRAVMAVLVLLIIAAAPFADGRMHLHGWRFFPTVLAPSLMPLFMFLLPLDITMARIFMNDTMSSKRERLACIVKFEVVLWLALILAWLPFAVVLVRN